MVLETANIYGSHSVVLCGYYYAKRLIFSIFFFILGNQDTKLTPMKQVDAALRACTFGYFHIKILMIAFVGNVAGVFISTSTGYLLPVAECDLHMTLLRKGVLNAMPYMG